MHEIDTSGIRVQVLWGGRHHWQSGDEYHHDPWQYLDVRFLYKLWLIQRGEVEVRSGDQSWRVKAGEVCLLPISLEHRVRAPGPTSWLSIGLRLTAFQQFELLHNVTLPAQWKLSPADFTLMEALIEQIMQHKYRPQMREQLIINGLGQAVLGFCWPHLSHDSIAASIHSSLPDWLKRVLEQISLDPSCHITNLAREAGFSPSQFRRVFHQHVGTAPRDYLVAKRMEMACHYLEYTTLSLRHIAAKIGIHNVPHFSRAFKKTFGMTPSQYRSSLNTHKQDYLSMSEKAQSIGENPPKKRV